MVINTRRFVPAIADIAVVMRQEHQAGEKLYVDYAGMTIDLVNPKTGEVTAMVVFVATFGASNYI